MKIIQYFSIMVLILISCKKETNTQQYSTLIIKPKTLGCSNDGVRVRIFSSESDYQNATNAIYDVYSEGENPVVFDKLEAKIYYYRLDKLCGQPVTNAWCDESIRKYTTNGSLNPDQTQEIEVLLCYP